MYLKTVTRTTPTKCTSKLKEPYVSKDWFDQECYRLQKTIKQCWRVLTCLRVTKIGDVCKIVSVYTSPILKEGSVLFINVR